MKLRANAVYLGNEERKTKDGKFYTMVFFKQEGSQPMTAMLKMDKLPDVKEFKEYDFEFTMSEYQGQKRVDVVDITEVKKSA